MGREVEWPEVRCYGKHVTVEVAAAAGAAAVGGGAARRLVINEEDIREYTPGVRWQVAQWVQVREAAGAPWQMAQVLQWGKCNARMGAGARWEDRRADCFVLLLTRDGSHGLDLSKGSSAFRLSHVTSVA